MSAKAIAKAILSALGEGGVHHISLPPEEIRILCEAVLAPRPEVVMTATRVELSKKAFGLIMQMQHTYGVPASLIDELRRLDAAFHESPVPQEGDAK